MKVTAVIFFAAIVSCLLGCSNEQKLPIRAVPASFPLTNVIVDKDQRWPTKHNGIAQWDEKYLYLRLKTSSSRIVPESTTLELSFGNRPNIPRRTIFIFPNGRCFDPFLCSLGLVELPAQDVFCRTTLTDRLWIADVRIPLIAIHAIGNQTYLTAKFRGVRRHRNQEPVEPFEDTYGGKINFVHPRRNRPKIKPVSWMDAKKSVIGVSPALREKGE